MRKVKIITDSCADLSAEQLEKYDIDYARMSTIEDGKESPALLTWTPAEAHRLYETIRGGKRITTAQVSVEEFKSCLKNILGLYQLGAVYTGLFAVLGHAYPIWYGFKGGKGFLVSLSTIWVTDWRVGLIVTGMMVVLLLTTKYMSLATVAATLCSPLLLLLFKAPVSVILIDAAIVIFVALRHKENFRRLKAGTESKFTLSTH